MFSGASALQQHAAALLIGLPRLACICHFAPFMGGSHLLAPVRFAVIAALYLMVHPAVLGHVPAVFQDMDGLFLGCIMLKEVFLGVTMAYLAGFAFWTLEGAGMFIDNQRGAAQATDSNPVTGEQTSPTGSFFFQSGIYLFYSSGAFVAFLAAVYASYEFWPPWDLLPADVFRHPDGAVFFARKVASLAADIVLLSGPVVLACLFVDMGLGIVNRFASQLQVYILAMPVKSGIAALLLLFYFGMLLKDAGGMFDAFHADLQWLRRWLP